MEDIRKGVCPLCGHTEIVKTLPTGVLGVHVLVALFAHHENRGSVFSPEAKSSGELQAFVCRACGFSQCFADHPSEIPIGPEHHTELVQATAAQGPYR